MNITQFLTSLTEDQLYAFITVLRTIELKELYSVDHFLGLAREELDNRSEGELQ